MLSEVSRIESKFKVCMNALVRLVGSFLIIALIGLDLGDRTSIHQEVDSFSIALAVADTDAH